MMREHVNMNTMILFHEAPCMNMKWNKIWTYRGMVDSSSVLIDFGNTPK